MRMPYAMLSVLCVAAGLMVAGCGTVTKTAPPEWSMVASSEDTPVIDPTAKLPESPDADTEQSDPWAGFNEKMFAFNYNLDKYALKPVARGYRAVVPDFAQVMLGNVLNNVAFVPRFVNSLLQAKWGGAVREVGRFVLNSTFGFGGLIDVGRTVDLQPSDQDFGLTLAAWGVRPGPYLVLPFLGPTTVRDGIGKALDGAMSPLSYYAPFVAQVGMRGGDTVNDRALNYDLFAGVEETTIDLYSSVRHYYLNRRERLIEGDLAARGEVATSSNAEIEEAATSGEGAFDGVEEHPGIERLGQEVHGAVPHRLHRDRDLTVGR